VTSPLSVARRRGADGLALRSVRHDHARLANGEYRHGLGVQLARWHGSPPPQSSKAHLAHVSTLSSRARVPYQASYAADGGDPSRCPVSCCLSAAGVCFLGHLVPAEDIERPSRSAYRGAHTSPGLDGVATFRMCKTRSGWVPPMPQSGGAPATGWVTPVAACRFPAASSTPQYGNPSTGLTLTRLEEVHSRSPVRSSPHL